MKKIYFLFCSLFVLNVMAQQIKEFTPNMPNYPNEVLQYVTYNDDINDEEIFVIEKLKAFWDSARFNIDEKDKIMSISNNLLLKKIRPRPQFTNFIKLVVYFKINNIDEQSFSNWLNAFMIYTEKSNVTMVSIEKIMQNTFSLVGEKALSVFAAGRWVPRSKQFKVDNANNRFWVIFPKTDIVAYNLKMDSIEIKETSGRFDLTEMIWYGQGGIVTWERAGIPQAETYVRLSKYKIDLFKIEYKADSVNFYNAKYFKNPVLGKLEDRVAHIASPENATYPEYDTYKKTFDIKNLYPGINYTGGYSMRGQKFIGRGTAVEPAMISVIYKDTIRVRALSNYFVLTPEKITGIRSRVSVYLLKDSVYHGNVTFQYFVESKELNVVQTQEYSARGPYRDSYHKMNMIFPQLRWKISETDMFFTFLRGTSVSKSNFESFNYFDPMFFEAMMGMDEQHPLYALKRYSDKIKYPDFPVDDYAQFIRHSPDQVRTQITQLMILGYLVYDPDYDYIYLQPKLYESVNASLGRIDYDVIKFESNTVAPQENAKLNVRNYDLTINGIPNIRVSNAQNVVIYPDSARIIMKSNRSFRFDGRIDAGLFTFIGKNFYFTYDSFRIDMQKIDSIRIRILLDSFDMQGQPIIQPLRSSINNTSGFLYVDKHDNKSGKRNYAQYPVFTATKPSYVYYDRASNAYGKTDFYFELLPFTFDSLNTFDARELKLAGRFVSGGIFPDLQQTMIVQEDYSLGFDFEQPMKDLPAYGGKGTFDVTLSLSNKGLRGKGSLDYLSSTTYSEDFKLYPDSMNTDAKRFNIERTPPTYPYVNVDTARVRWKPKEDKMLVKNLKDPFIVINDRTKLTGILDLRPSGLNGDGVMDLTTATMKSNNFHYGSDQINADTTEFNLLSLKSSGMTMKTQNVKANIDYTQNKGEFKSNTGASFTEFPENQYVSYLDEFTWDMNRKEVAMRSGTKHAQPYTVPDSLYKVPNELVGAKFVSVKKVQDSLNFVTKNAVYDYQHNIIDARDVEYIRVADALIFPDKKRVIIEEKALMRKLENSRIMANVDSRYHHFHTAGITIESSKSYVGAATYDYIDENSKIQAILFNEMKVDESTRTVGFGNITEPDSFYLSPMFRYIGKVNLSAWEQLLYFNGAAQITIACDTMPETWVQFKSKIDPWHIYIPLGDKLQDINRNNLYAGTLMSTFKGIHLFSTFMNKRHDYDDKFIITADGFLTFDKVDSSYKISSMEKLKDFYQPGNYLSLQKDSCIQYGEGQVNLNVELGQLKLKSVGSLTHKLPEDRITLNISLGLDFMMLEQSMNQMAADIDTFARNIPINISDSAYTKKMTELMGVKMTDLVLNELVLYGKLKEIPEELNHTLFLSDVNLYWNKHSRSYCSMGKIGIGNIKNHQLNRYVDGYLEITRKRSGDYLDLYIKINDKLWYYFGYTRGVMQVLSPEKLFTEPIQLLKPEQRTMKTKRNQTPYTYLVSTDMKFYSFIKRFEDYKNLQAEDELMLEVDDDEEGGKDKRKKKKKEEDVEEKLDEKKKVDENVDESEEKEKSENIEVLEEKNEKTE